MFNISNESGIIQFIIIHIFIIQETCYFNNRHINSRWYYKQRSQFYHVYIFLIFPIYSHDTHLYRSCVIYNQENRKRHLRFLISREALKNLRGSNCSKSRARARVGRRDPPRSEAPSKKKRIKRWRHFLINQLAPLRGGRMINLSISAKFFKEKMNPLR